MMLQPQSPKSSPGIISPIPALMPVVPAYIPSVPRAGPTQSGCFPRGWVAPYWAHVGWAIGWPCSLPHPVPPPHHVGHQLRSAQSL